MNNDKPLSIQRDDERRSRILPTRDSHTFFPGAARRANEGDSRVREHKADQFRDWFLRSKGRAASDAEVAQYLNQPGSNDAA